MVLFPGFDFNFQQSFQICLGESCGPLKELSLEVLNTLGDNNLGGKWSSSNSLNIQAMNHALLVKKREEKKRTKHHAFSLFIINLCF